MIQWPLGRCLRREYLKKNESGKTGNATVQMSFIFQKILKGHAWLINNYLP